MPEVLISFYKAASIIDMIYIIFTILSLIKCYKKGFVLSILSMAKWFLAYIITLIISAIIGSFLVIRKKRELKISIYKKILTVISGYLFLPLIKYFNFSFHNSIIKIIFFITYHP